MFVANLNIKFELDNSDEEYLLTVPPLGYTTDSIHS